MNRILIIKDCLDDCPSAIEKESHGTCGSDYWTECRITGEVIQGEDNWEASKWRFDGKDKHFPPSCPLKKTKRIK